MMIAKASQAAGWISSDEIIAGGLGLLGLRLPVPGIGGSGPLGLLRREI
jgi:hypothetical protein